MRLLRLSLERYGAFTDRDMRFRPGARLHVVLGANEAGKSTALAAVGDLLFGFGKSTDFAFLHEMPALRLGAEIEAADGRRLSFRRRKGNRATLISADEAPMPDDALAPFLGGLTREVFCRAFGLDSANLRAGGREMVDVEGEVGASLFAAGSGLRGLTELQAGLDAEADAIFAPKRAKHRTFYQALDRYEDARTRARNSALRAGDWRALNDRIAAAGDDLDAVRAERERIAAERVRLERLKRARPIVSAIDALDRAIAEDRGLIAADAAWIDRLGGMLDAARAAQAEASRAAVVLDRAGSEANAVPVEPALVERADAILAAFTGIKEFEKHGKDLPRVQGEADTVALELDRLRPLVGVSDRAALEAAQPTAAARTRIERLVREGRALEASETRIGRDLAAAAAERDRLAQAVAAPDAARDPTRLREALRPFARLAEDIARHDAIETSIVRQTALLRDQAGRLVPPVTDTAVLARAPLPPAEAIVRFRERFEDDRRRRERAADRREAAARRADAIRERLSESEAGRPIATRERLDALRAAREAAFVPLRDALAVGSAAAPGQVSAYERAAFAADALADERASDAARVAAHAADADRLAAEEATLAAAGAALAEIATASEATEAAWRAQWHAAGIAPGPPAEMAAWLVAAEDLIEGEQALAERRLERTRLFAQIEGMRAPLADLCGRAGFDPLPGLEIAAILGGLEERVAALAARWEADRESAGQFRAAEAAATRLEATRAEAEATRAAWQAEWSRALAPIGLPSEARPDEAEAALTAWRDVPVHLSRRAELERRVAGMRRDREGFAATVAGLAADLAPDLVGAAPDAAIRSLHQRLSQAQAAAARRADLERRRDEAVRAAQTAAEARDAVRASLARQLDGAIPALADAPLAEIEALHARLSAREALLAERARLRLTLAGAADGIPESELRQGLDSLSPEAIEAELARLAMDSEAQEQRGRTVFSDRAEAERRRAELEGGSGAELAWADRKAAEAELHAAARSWAVLRIAGLMLGQAVARQRAGSQDPLVSRAGALFTGLTGGAFDGLAQTYDAADTPKLAGRRPGGGLVGIEGLSEGTRDQLYLALRLAYLEDFSTRAEAAPFIGDDLFSTFDDARTGHGLEALAAIGTRVQPILFTHHRHVAEIARTRLGEAVDVLEL